MRSLFGVRHHLHPVFLSVPDLVSEKQVLFHMSHLQLGLCHDVHAAVLCPKILYMEPAGTIDSPVGPMGNRLFQTS